MDYLNAERIKMGKSSYFNVSFIATQRYLTWVETESSVYPPGGKPPGWTEIPSQIYKVYAWNIYEDIPNTLTMGLLREI